MIRYTQNILYLIKIMIISSRKAFTLVEIMIVVAIVAIILAVALPNYLKSGKTSAKNICISNLKQIDGAIEQWALDHDIAPGTYPSSQQEEEIYGYIKEGKPKCTSGGEYTIHAIGSNPQVACSREDEGHKLPE